MAMDVIDLLSEDEETSPGQAARISLDSFAPRKDRIGIRNFTGPGAGQENELESPEKDVMVVLNSFRPRKERQAEIGGRGNGHSVQGSSTNGPDSGASPTNNELGGLIVPRPSNLNIERSSDTEVLKQGSSERRAPSHPPSRLVSSPGKPSLNKSYPHAEQGSLAALLKQAQDPTLATLPTSAGPIASSRSSKSHALSKSRPQPATSFYGQTHGSARPSSALDRTPATVKNTRQRSAASPQFPQSRGLEGESTSLQQAPLRYAPRLAIVDTFEKNTAAIDEADALAGIRPYKRPRLSGPDLGVQASEEKRSTQNRNGLDDTAAAPVFKWPDVNGRLSSEPLSRAQATVKSSSPSLNVTEPRSPTSRKLTSPLFDAAGPRSPTSARHTTARSAVADLRSPTSVEPSISRSDGARQRSSLPKKATEHGEQVARLPLQTSEYPQQTMTRAAQHSGYPSVDATEPSAAALTPKLYDGLAQELPEPSLPPSHPAVAKPNATFSTFGNQYTPEEDALLAELKEVKNMRWDEMLPHFNGRTKGSLQVRYSTKVSKRHQTSRRPVAPPLKTQRTSARAHDTDASDSGTATGAPARRQRKKRNVEASAVSGMISWDEVRRRRQMVDGEDGEESRRSAPFATRPQFHQERAYPRSLSCALRQRELGSRGRGGMQCERPVTSELKEHIFDNVGPLKYHKGTSGDVTCIAWSPNGRHFAAGSIAISDERSMQYNRPGNLLVGDYERSQLRELPEHHVPRPAIEASGNVNGLHSMRESLDPRLFMTVASVQFSPNGSTLYSAGTDAKVRAYNVTEGETACAYSIDHPAPLDLLSVSNANVLATACHQSADGSIGVYQDQEKLASLSPSRVEQQTSRAIYPSALKWGVHHYHSNFLVAGFSIDSIDAERDIAGETCLWDIAAERRVQVPVTRNIFDVAWNPRPTSTSTVFAIASTPGTQKVSRGTRTVVQCFAPNQGRASRVLEWESPAFDMNDVVYCQHDDNLLAAGATDGKIYIWDRRFAGRKPTPLHVFEHGDSLNVLDHDREREIADTGVRFLSWGATSTRLYTGSSDGVVKIWNPYMATENAHVKDVAAFGSAVMSGAFSPDYRDLLIGEDQGRINSLSIWHEEKAVRSMRKFEFLQAPAPEEQQDHLDVARELVHSQQIVFRPMGDLPVRQAVQGPNYKGPYLAPTPEAQELAEQEYDDALIEQSRARREADTADSDNESSQTAIKGAAKLVSRAQEEIAKLENKCNEAAYLYQAAQAHQRTLIEAEKHLYKLEAFLPHDFERCKLDCNYLPANADDEVLDSGRSEMRIPDALRSLLPRETTLLTADELREAGLTSKCISCSGPAAQPKRGLPLCEHCAVLRQGLTAKCEQCAAPVRPPTESAGSNLCEKCSFACFRCGRVARLTEDREYIKCAACMLSWKVGVLGYELVGGSSQGLRIDRQRKEQHVAFVEDEMERYAAIWGTTG